MIPREISNDAVPACDREALRRGLAAAIAFGAGETGLDEEAELASGAHDLMCRAGETSIDVALVAQVFKAQVRLGEEMPAGKFRRTARLMRDTAAGCTRLVARALEVHARDTGYSAEVWMLTAFDTTSLFLQDSRDAGRGRMSVMPPLFARIGARSLFDALAACNADRMAVPGYLADSLGANLALFMHAQTAVSGVAENDFI